MLIYVDDIILTGNLPSTIDSLITMLGNEFALKYLSPLHYFLGIEVPHTPKGLFLCQSKYTINILAKMHMLEASKISTPMVVTSTEYSSNNDFSIAQTYHKSCWISTISHSDST